MDDKAKVLAVLNSLQTGDKTAAETHISAEKYIQHNPQVPNGRDALVGFLPVLKQQGTTVKTVRVLQDGELVVAHSEYFLFGKKQVGFDIFRFDNGKIVEHWDVLQDFVEKTASGRSQSDGPTEATEPGKTSANKSFVTAFASDVLGGKNPGKVVEYVSLEKYHQHNPAVGDGLAALGQALEGMAKAGTPMKYTKTHRVIAEGNFVFTHSEGEFLGKHVAFADLFRVENGKIVEHWDAIQEVPATTASGNGMF
ncbi:MAG: nuclear transport factor 2 family protein [Saprospiraceae bacterium]|nr:nuclear transport factor 2 family protein [Saprospiraceae bacterium]